MTAEHERTRLIGEIASLLREGAITEEARAAGLTLIGWLARRMPGEPASTAGVHEMLQRSNVGTDELGYRRAAANTSTLRRQPPHAVPSAYDNDDSPVIRALGRSRRR